MVTVFGASTCCCHKFNIRIIIRILQLKEQFSECFFTFCKFMELKFVPKVKDLCSSIWKTVVSYKNVGNNSPKTVCLHFAMEWVLFTTIVKFMPDELKCHKRRAEISAIIALLTNNTDFGPGFSYSDWQNSSRDQSNLEPYWLAYRSENPYCWS